MPRPAVLLGSSGQPPEPFGQLFELRPEGRDSSDSALIWLHCGGGHGCFARYTVGAELRKALPSTALLFPSGKMQLPFPRWINFGYDKTSVALGNVTSLLEFGSCEGMAESVAYIHALVEREIARGVRPDRVFLAGFSQGGTTALAAGLSSRVRLGGVLGVSTFHLGRVPSDAPRVPIRLFHGDADGVVPLAWAEHSKAVLESGGMDVSLRVYAGLWHNRCEEETNDVVAAVREGLQRSDSQQTL